MATSTPPAAPTPAPTPAPAKPGYKTSEAWLTFIARLLGALPSSGLLANDPPAVVKAVGLATAALAAMGYTANRTNLKRALVAGSGALIVSLGLAIGVTIAALSPGCATAKAVGTCELTTLEQGSNGSTLLAQVEADLLKAQYLAALETTAATVGEAAVTCVLQAIEAFTTSELGLGAGSGSGSGGAVAPAVVSRTQLLHDNAAAALKARAVK